MNKQRLAIAYVQFLLAFCSSSWVHMVLQAAIISSGAAVFIHMAAQGLVFAAIPVGIVTFAFHWFLQEWLAELRYLAHQWLLRNKP